MTSPLRLVSTSSADATTPRRARRFSVVVVCARPRGLARLAAALQCWLLERDMLSEAAAPAPPLVDAAHADAPPPLPLKACLLSEGDVVLGRTLGEGTQVCCQAAPPALLALRARLSGPPLPAVWRALFRALPCALTQPSAGGARVGLTYGLASLQGTDGSVSHSSGFSRARQGHVCEATWKGRPVAVKIMRESFPRHMLGRKGVRTPVALRQDDAARPDANFSLAHSRQW